MSAPRIPNDIEYWKRKGKSGKDVCIIFHDDMDGIVSAIIMKKWLDNKGFNIKKYALINYQESWEALKLDPKLINIALDFAEDSDDVDVYMDHHGVFDDEVRLTQQKHSIKTHTGSAAEGIALQLGVPFGSVTKDWIDMIDSAKYYEYKVDISDILNFDLKVISKDKNSKLRFAAAFNQLIKRSDHTTFIEIVNASKDVSIYNIYRLFKIFFPKNNPNWKSGEESDFVADAQLRLETMQERTRGKYVTSKTIYMSQSDFWDDYATKISEIKQYKNNGWKLAVSNYEIIGNLMFVPSGTWANALRAKAIFVDDIKSGMLPGGNDKRNFTLLQYGNTLQIADLVTKVEHMDETNLPTLKNGKMKSLGKYMDSLVKNFETHLGYDDVRTKSGGHYGIGSISNIFGHCKVAPYVGIPFLDMFKNKIINDISAVKWSLSLPWNDEVSKSAIPEDQINQRMLSVSEIRSEEDAMTEKKERIYLSYVNRKQEYSEVMSSDFETDSLKKIYEYLSNISNLTNLGRSLTPTNMSKIWFKKRSVDDSNMTRVGVSWSMIFDTLTEHFDLGSVYDSVPSEDRKYKRKETKRLLILIGDIVRGDYIDDGEYELEYDEWKEKLS